MSYTITDILDKFIKINDIRINVYEEYEEILKIRESKDNLRYIIIVKSLIKEVYRENEYYDIIKKTRIPSEMDEVNFLSYDKISFSMESFKKNVNKYKVNDCKQIISSFIDIEQDILALMITVQGMLVLQTEDTETLAYNVLTEVIKERQNSITKLSKLN